MSIRDVDNPVSPMWYGYAFETIYIVLGTVLIAILFGILAYH